MCDSDCGCGHHTGGECPKHRPERGWLQLLFLRLIHEKPMHGYQIMEELNGKGYVSDGRLEAGTVYTILRRMEHRGLLTSKWEEKGGVPDRRTYRVTPEGEDVLRRGIEAMNLRKEVLDNLSTYYNDHLKK
jgi:DNA-binding PadR family transcriptional regulator